jgi:hypothetical protein
MAEGGLDVRTWVTLVAVFVIFVAIPGFLLEYDRRKTLRETAGTDQGPPADAPEPGQPLIASRPSRQ